MNLLISLLENLTVFLSLFFNSSLNFFESHLLQDNIQENVYIQEKNQNIYIEFYEFLLLNYKQYLIMNLP